MRGLGAWAFAALVGCRGTPAEHADARTAVDGTMRDATSDATLPTVVPLTMETIKIDGDWDESDWNNLAVQFIFTSDDGEQARPYSEVRFMRDDVNLYIGAYAADNDIETSDFFQFTLGVLDFRINPYGDLAASEPGLVAAAEYDGTINDPDDEDEEWLLEASVPLALISLDVAPVQMRASRCDIPKNESLRCGATAAMLVAPASPIGRRHSRSPH